MFQFPWLIYSLNDVALLVELAASLHIARGGDDVLTVATAVSAVSSKSA